MRDHVLARITEGSMALDQSITVEQSDASDRFTVTIAVKPGVPFFPIQLGDLGSLCKWGITQISVTAEGGLLIELLIQPK